mmetsp:Transcript_24375/g.40409  ORF Transcript_24375/g.40409 Transcript_24375/m.40409 type:complete len:114 (+) Transcript_24375:295-636(+)|eukprot:CAMPEP_0119011274 /NCGR_PEP_ID=MMETSP1176-20130426/5570_1 /TAXON_ID=265551 /ORGANISM="Synedropsis recta cf, Strain CCMP1620" /LENGTH=113 /DNA_ID=CAMNT_0006964073 /DNA_START=265 /DNA_END=606 /DNA_ORIENTATION=+
MAAIRLQIDVHYDTSKNYRSAARATTKSSTCIVSVAIKGHPDIGRALSLGLSSTEDGRQSPLRLPAVVLEEDVTCSQPEGFNDGTSTTGELAGGKLSDTGSDEPGEVVSLGKA